MPEETEVDLRMPVGPRVRIVGDASDASIIGSMALRDGAYEPGLVDLLAAHARPDWVSLDVGANVGPISLVLGRLCPDGEVHAFEPANDSFAFLARNIAASGAANIHPHHQALMDVAGEVTINYDPVASGAAFISDHLAAGSRQQVQATTVDAFVAESGIDRVDLIKIDVEGSESLVLDGARETLARHRPTLVVELNPITTRRMQLTEPRDLYRQLSRLYRGPLHLAHVPEFGPALPIVSWRHVQRILAEQCLCNLLCSPAPLLPGRSPGIAGAAASVRALAENIGRYNRFRLPTHAAIYDPHVEARLDQSMAGPRGLVRGRPGERVSLPLLVVNRGRTAIVGASEVFPVSWRLIWIDGEGHHTIDDRTRRPVPTMRSGSGASVRLPVHLPDEAGTYLLRVGLFQEGIAWFHDLDPQSCLELEVEVVEP